MDAAKKTEATPAALARAAEPRPEQCSRWPPRLSKGLSTPQMGWRAVAKFFVEKKFSSLGVFISIHRVSQNKETIQIRWFGRFKTKEVFSHGIQLNCGARGCRVWWGPRGITPHLPCFCLFSVYPWGLQEQTALAAPASFARAIGGCGSGGDSPVAPPALRTHFRKGVLALAQELLVAADSGSLK